VGEKIEVAVLVAVGPTLVEGIGVLVRVGGIKITLVDVGVTEGLGTDMLVAVLDGTKVNVPVGDGIGGTGVSKEAPGVRKTSIQAGLVRMDGSRGSKNPIGMFVRKSLSGLRFDPMSAGSFQLGAKRSAQPLEMIIQMNPTRRMSSMRPTESRLSRSLSGAFMETSIYR
jgi:hypothetical protein